MNFLMNVRVKKSEEVLSHIVKHLENLQVTMKGYFTPATEGF
jgi:hypothetical protein